MFLTWIFLRSLTEAEELFASSSEEEADAEEAGGANCVVDVEDTGNIMGLSLCILELLSSPSSTNLPLSVSAPSLSCMAPHCALVTALSWNSRP